MNLDPLSFGLNQISNSVGNLTKKNFKSVTQEIGHVSSAKMVLCLDYLDSRTLILFLILQLISAHGEVAERHLVRCLFSHVDFVDQTALKNASSGFVGREAAQAQYLASKVTDLLERPYHISTLCFSIDNPHHHQVVSGLRLIVSVPTHFYYPNLTQTLKPSPNLIPNVCKVLRLNEAQEIVFGFALIHSDSNETKKFAQDFLRFKFPAFCKHFCATGKLHISLCFCPTAVTL